MTKNKKLTEEEMNEIINQRPNKSKINWYAAAFFFTTLLSLALCWVVIQEAQFYCINYCEVQGGSLARYSPGHCSCQGIHKITIDEPTEIEENHTWPGIQ